MVEDNQKKIDESWKEKARTEPVKDEAESKGKNFPKPDFNFFLTTLAMQAWIGLGIIPNPATQKTEENIDQAKFIIDTIEMLQEKTKGNLAKEEQELCEHVLYELRVAYVNKSSGNK